jgi:hypothetical protein
MPEQMSLFKIAILLYKVFNSTVSGIDWVELNLNIISTS